MSGMYPYGGGPPAGTGYPPAMPTSTVPTGGMPMTGAPTYGAPTYGAPAYGTPAYGTGMPVVGATGGFTGGMMAGGMATTSMMAVQTYNTQQTQLNNAFQGLWMQASPIQSELKKLYPTLTSLQAQQRQMVVFTQTGQAATIPGFAIKMQAINTQLMQVSQAIGQYNAKLGELTRQAQGLFQQQQTLNFTRASLGGDANPSLVPAHVGLKSMPSFMMAGTTAPIATMTTATTGMPMTGMPMTGMPVVGAMGTMPMATTTMKPTMAAPTATMKPTVAAATKGVSAMAVSGSAAGGGRSVFHTPRGDATPAIKGPSSYSDSDAVNDCKALRTAMKGMGCNTEKVIGILGARTPRQREMIKAKFVSVDQLLYAKRGTRDLVKDLKSELSGKTEKVILNLMKSQGERDAAYIQNAMDGAGFDTELLSEVLFTRTPEEIRAMQSEWTSKIRAKRAMKERIRDETKKLMGKNNFQILCLKVLEARRPPGCGKVDSTKVQADAEQLTQLLSRAKTSEVKAAFIEVFTERSFEHIGALAGVFSTISKKWTMHAAIAKAMGDGSDTAKALRVIAEYSAQPYDFWAKKLVTAMAGFGTDDSALIRLVTTRCDVDLTSVAQVFGDRYGKGKTLMNWIKSDTSGNYRKILLKICGY